MAGYLLDEKSFQLLRKVVREEMGRVRNPNPGHRRTWWGSTPQQCPPRNEIHQITIIGKPTGGTLDCTLNVNGTTETLTFNWGDTAAAVKTELETHSQIAVDDVTVTGGPFPNATIQIEFVETLEATAVPLPTLDWTSLTGGTGVSAFASRPQSGFPN